LDKLFQRSLLSILRPTLTTSAINFTAMTECDRIENVLPLIKLLEAAVIADAKPIDRPAFEPVV